MELSSLYEEKDCINNDWKEALDDYINNSKN